MGEVRKRQRMTKRYCQLKPMRTGGKNGEAG